MFADDHFSFACDAKYGFSSNGAGVLAADVDTASQVNKLVLLSRRHFVMHAHPMRYRHLPRRSKRS
jgi:hypothetical protein